MAVTSGRKLKVFRTQIGFHETVVAAPSQAAALRAWGTHQNLFSDGSAYVTTDQSAAALAHPEIPLSRAVGSHEPFRVEPTSVPRLPEDGPHKAKQPISRKKAAAPPGPPDRSKLNAAETALLAMDQRRKQEETDLRREEEALTIRQKAARQAYIKARKQAVTAVSIARDEYRRAGGKD